MPFRYNENVLIDDVTVNGKKITGNVDTGADGTFALTPAATAALGLESQMANAETSSSIGYNGVSNDRKGQVQNVTVGGISVYAPTVTFFGKGTGRDRNPGASTSATDS